MKTLRARVGVNLTSNAALTLVGFFTAPLLARGLGVGGRGEVVAAIAPLALCATAFNFGMPAAVTYFVARGGYRARAVLARAGWVMLAASVPAMGATFAARSWLSSGNGDLTRLISLSSVAIFPTMLVSLLQAAAIGRDLWGHVLAERVTSAVLRVILLALLMFGGHLTPTNAVVVLCWVPVLAGTVYLFTWRALGEVAVKTGASHGLMRFGVQVWVGSVSGLLLSRLDQLLIVPLASTAALGHYAVAVSLSEVALIVNSTFREVMVTEATRWFDGVRLAAASRISTVAALAIGAGCAAASWVAIPVLFGPAFEAAVMPTWILILAVILGSPGSLAGVALMALGQPGLRSCSQAVGCAINVAALVVLVPTFGAVGAALATLVGNMTAANLAIYWLKTRHSVMARDFYRISRSDLVALTETASRAFRGRSG
ncbi:polysaccharide biosynthesis C-terminal domain-containing protein [Streptomyces sp. NPDC050564]|uniref:oligosaccharide flippase family protein n=1 Tax=Streptomyces sp. NPDC050564 TaxID=3365631 RepID=UPI00379045BA